MEKKQLVTVAVVVLIMVAVPLLRYGTLSPCGALKQRLHADLIKSLLESKADGPWAAAGQALGLAVAGPMLDSFIGALSPWKCVRGLAKFEFGGESPFGDEMNIGGQSPFSTTEDVQATIEEEEPRWRRHIDTSPIDDSTSVVLIKDADSPISGWVGEEVTPTLVLRCKENKTEAYFLLHTRLETESYDSVYAMATYRLDKEVAKRENFLLSTDNDALFFRQPISKIKEMLEHEQIVLRATPKDKGDQTVTFVLTGLSEQIDPLRKACGW